MKIKELYSDIVRLLEKRADAETASKKIAQAQYFGVKYKSYGLRKSEEIELIGSYLSSFEQLSLEERFKLAKRFYASGFYEQANFGDAILELSLEDMTPAHYDSLDDIASYLSNWAEIDWFCIRVVQPLLRKYPKETLKLLRKWNKAKNCGNEELALLRLPGKSG